MRHLNSLMELLRPLGVYREDGILHRGELEVQGEALDQVMERTLELEREMLPATARQWGLERMAELFCWRPVTKTAEELAAAVAALSRIGGDSFTLAAINDAMTGCGINARAMETETPGKVRVIFPEVAGIPEGFEQIRTIVEEILPAHLSIEYHFWYIIWKQLEEIFPNWQALQERNISWSQLEVLVE